MKTILITVGETHKRWAAQGEKEYLERLNHYIDFEKISTRDIRNTKKLSEEQQKQIEGKDILGRLQPADIVALLDEHGKTMTSREFSKELQGYMNRGTKRLIFVIGGPYGFSKEVYDRADALYSFSNLTFPHDLIRVIFLEQLYRAHTILRNEPYHHD